MNKNNVKNHSKEESNHRQKRETCSWNGYYSPLICFSPKTPPRRPPLSHDPRLSGIPLLPSKPKLPFQKSFLLNKSTTEGVCLMDENEYVYVDDFEPYDSEEDEEYSECSSKEDDILRVCAGGTGTELRLRESAVIHARDSAMAARSQDGDQDHQPQQQQQPSAAAEEEEFQRLLQEIGKERIHLVSNASRADDGARGRVLEEFVQDVFQRAPADSRLPRAHSANWIPSPQCARAADKANSCHASRRARGAARAIDCALVVFVLTREFLARDRGGVHAKEILKDVRGRLRKGCAPPALLGLVYRAEAPGESCACLRVLEDLLRSVFARHPPEAIWVGQFAPGAPEAVQTIKRNLCRTVRVSLCEGSVIDKGSPILQMLKCLPVSRSGRCKEGPSPGRAESAEKDIPLQKISVTDGEHKPCSSSGQDVQEDHHCQPI
ncbi:hypothetical protein GN956_G15990 [Arapaima gigas]